MKMNYLKTSIKALQQRTRKEGRDTNGETREMLQREKSLTMHLRLNNNPRFCLRLRTSTKNRAIIAASAFIFVVLMASFQEGAEKRTLTNYIGSPEDPAQFELLNLPIIDSTIKDGLLSGTAFFSAQTNHHQVSNIQSKMQLVAKLQ